MVWSKAASLCAGVAGLFFHVMLRMNPRVTVFGSIADAVSRGDLSLGYAIGPGLGVLGFVLALFTATFVRAEQMSVSAQSASDAE